MCTCSYWFDMSFVMHSYAPCIHAMYIMCAHDSVHVMSIHEHTCAHIHTHVLTHTDIDTYIQA